MTHRQLKAGYIALAGVNTLAASYFFNYLFFFFRDRFGFGNRENLGVTAMHGFIYLFAAWQCGQFAQRRGQLLSLKVGFLGLTLVMVGAALLDGFAGQLLMLAGYSVAVCFTWPALESLATERETPAGRLRMVGLYNCVWAGGAAVAYFTGGELYQALGKGAIFWLPAALFAAQFLFTVWLDRHHAAVLAATPKPRRESPHTPEARAFRQPVRPEAFLKMAWLANPFAYIAINTLIPIMPEIAQRLELSTARVGLFCSVWFFGRFAAFLVLWRWPGWHYRFRWLLGSFLLLIAGFATILLTAKLWVIILAQIGFGLACGLIYYSSLFYAMDVGEGSSEHGGIHEAFIGLGICLGPAVGVTSLQLAPRHPDAGAWAVSGLLVLGLAGLVWLRLRK